MSDALASRSRAKKAPAPARSADAASPSSRTTASAAHASTAPAQSPSWAAASAAPPFALAAPVQRKVAVGPPGDAFEQEADRVAAHATGGGPGVVPVSRLTPGAFSPLPQRLPEEEEETVQAMRVAQRASGMEEKEEAPVQAMRLVQRAPGMEEEREEAPVQAMRLARRAPGMEEEEAPAEAVQAMRIAQRAAAAAPPEDEEEAAAVQAKGTPGAPVGGEAKLDARLRSPGAGEPIPRHVRASVEPVLGADLSGVRVHADAEARSAAKSIQARAFTHGAGIWLGAGESAHDVGLMAHEAAHVVQQGAASAHASPAHAAPAAPAAAPAQAAVQRIPDWILEELNDYAGYIPGWTLFTVIIGYNPLLGEDVERTPTNLLGGLMGLIPFGKVIFDALNERGIVQDAFDWVSGELSRLDLSLGRIERTIEAAWEDVDVLEGWDYNIGVLKDHFGKLYDDVVEFAGSLVDKVMQLIKDAVVGVAEGLLAENRAWALIKKILKRDPLRDEPVEATPTEILEDFLVLIGKEEHLAQMRERGTVEETANWIAAQIETFLGLLGELRGLVTRAWDAIQPANLPDLMTNLRTLAADAGGFLQRVWDFAVTVADKVLELIKNALLGWLATFADDVPGFHLLTVILGRNPFTGEKVPRTAANLIRGFITLLPGGAGIYAKLEETGAIARTAARIEGAIEALGITWELIVGIFTGLWNSFSIDDLVDPLGAFQRIVDQFAEPVRRLFRFVTVVLREMITIVLEIMNFPSDLIGSIIANAMQAIDDVRRDPIGFLLNMLAAVKKGFTSFFDNILTHLTGGLADWLFRGLKQAGITPPADLTLGSVLDFVMQVLGIGMDKIWEKLSAKLGKETVERIRATADRLEGIWSFITDIRERGVAAIWEHIQSQISGLWDMVLQKAQDWIMERIVNKAIQWLLALLDITGIMPVINSFIAFFKAVQSAIEYLRDILAIINDYVTTIAAVARGEIDPGAQKMERGLANAIPVAIGFLANQFGLGNIGEKIQEIVAGIREVVDKALDWLVGRAVEMGKAMLSVLGIGGEKKKDEEKKEEKPADGEDRWWTETYEFTDGNGAKHTLLFTGEQSAAALVVHSPEELVVSSWLETRRDAETNPDERKKFEEALAAYTAFVPVRNARDAMSKQWKIWDKTQRAANKAAHDKLEEDFSTALREVGRTFTALTIGAMPKEIVLELPPQKAPGLYQEQVARKKLQHSKQRPDRETDQVAIWKKWVRPRLDVRQVAWARQVLGLSDDRMLRPNWDRQGVETEMHVDHIVEWQVRPLGDEKMLDDPWNYELLDKDSNEFSGKAVRGAADKARKAAAEETHDQSWLFRDLTFTKVTGGGSLGKRWAFDEVASGDHLEAYREARDLPEIEASPDLDLVLEEEALASGEHEVAENKVLIEDAITRLQADHPTDAALILQALNIRVESKPSWEKVKKDLKLTDGDIKRLRALMASYGIPETGQLPPKPKPKAPPKAKSKPKP